MKTLEGKEIVYSINVDDLQHVSMQILERPLTDAELNLIKNSVGHYVDWFQAIESAIKNHIHE